MRRLLTPWPGGCGSGGEGDLRRPGWSISGRCQLSGRAAPNAHADSGGPAPQNEAAVPATVPRPVPILIRSRVRGHSKSDGLTLASRQRQSVVGSRKLKTEFLLPSAFCCCLLANGVQLGRAHGRGGSSGVRSCFSGGGLVGVGRTLGWCLGDLASSPYYLRQPRADLVCPPTHLRAVAGLLTTAVLK